MHIKRIYTIKHDYIKMGPATTTWGPNCIRLKLSKEQTSELDRRFSWSEQETHGTNYQLMY